MSNTALIIRPVTAPPIHVLECDGIRRRYVQRGEGSYYLATDNHPLCNDIDGRLWDGLRSHLRDWDQPHWELIQNHDGTVEIHACRPTLQEAMRGDLFGQWGSVIHLGKQPTSEQLRIGLHIARKLVKCNPLEGCLITFDFTHFIEAIVTDISLRLLTVRSVTRKSQSAA